MTGEPVTGDPATWDFLDSAAMPVPRCTNPAHMSASHGGDAWPYIDGLRKDLGRAQERICEAEERIRELERAAMAGEKPEVMS
jgi:hypothetical protein